VLKSVAKLSTEEFRKRALANVLLVGGSAGTEGIAQELKNRLTRQVIIILLILIILHIN